MNQIAHLPSAAATLDVEVLKTLVAIAETGSVTAAAQRVGRSAGAVSMQVKKLEETLGRVLFERSRQGMELNAEGERLLAYARRIVDLHREALDAFRAPELTGGIRVGIIDDFGGVRLSEVMASFARSHPRMTLDLVMGPSATLAPRLDRGELDLAVLTPGCAVPWRPSDLVLHEEPLIWAGREGGRAWRERPLPVALSSPGCAWRRAALEALERARVPYRVAYISEFYAAQKAAIQADLAVAPLPRSLLEAGLVQLRTGMPEIGSCRIALRFGPERSAAAEAIAGRIVESYGGNARERGAA